MIVPHTCLRFATWVSLRGSVITSKTTVCSSESCFISNVSTWLLVTTSNTAARFLPSTDVKIVYLFLVYQKICFELYTVFGS